MIINEDFFDDEIMNTQEDIISVNSSDKAVNDEEKGEYSLVFVFGFAGPIDNLMQSQKKEIKEELTKFKTTVNIVLEPFCSYLSDVVYVMNVNSGILDLNTEIMNVDLFGVPAVTVSKDPDDLFYSNIVRAVVYFNYDNKSLMNALRFYGSIVRIMTAFNHPEGYPVSILYRNCELYNIHRKISEVSGFVEGNRRASMIFHNNLKPNRIQRSYLMYSEDSLLDESAHNFCCMVLKDYENAIKREEVTNYLNKHNFKETAYKVEKER